MKTLILILFIFSTLTSCIDNKMIVKSRNNYKPIPKADSRHYKSVQERDGQDSSLAIGMSVSGGGSRAQYFGLGVLMGLEDVQFEDRSFLNEIDYFSTVSGGGFAIGYYLSLKKHGVLNDYSSFREFWNSVDRKENLQENVYHSARARTMVYHPFYERNLMRRPLVYRIDYEVLQNGKKYKNVPFGTLYLKDFFIPVSSDEKVILPMLVTNGTNYNNAERVPFMPHIIDSLKFEIPLSPKESIDIDGGYGLPLKFAIAGSAAFPGILPMMKYKLKNSEAFIRIVDGGVVDNLGYMTLFELLKSDKNLKPKKKALIVDCSGTGVDVQSIEDKRVSAAALLSRSLLYVVDVGQVNSREGIKYMAANEIDTNNILRIGFLTIRNQLDYLKSKISDVDKDALTKLENRIIHKKDNWMDVYYDLVSSKPFLGFESKNLSEIPTQKFNEFSLLDVFRLYELSSQIETKIKIYNEEKQVLVLAGRYSVYLEKENLQKMLKGEENIIGYEKKK